MICPATELAPAPFSTLIAAIRPAMELSVGVPPWVLESSMTSARLALVLLISVCSVAADALIALSMPAHRPVAAPLPLVGWPRAALICPATELAPAPFSTLIAAIRPAMELSVGVPPWVLESSMTSARLAFVPLICVCRPAVAVLIALSIAAHRPVAAPLPLVGWPMAALIWEATLLWPTSVCRAATALFSASIWALSEAMS